MPTAEYRISVGGIYLTVRGFEHGKPRLMTKVLVDGHRLFGVNARGEFFASGLRGQYSMVSATARSLAYLDAAAKLGLLDRKAVAALKKEHERAGKIRTSNWAARDLEDAAKKMGIDLPANIKRRIRNARRAHKRHTAALSGEKR